MSCLPVLLDQARAAPEPLKQELSWALQQVWETYYPLGEALDLAFHLGTVLCEMQYYPEALTFFHHSLQQHGPSPGTLFNIGLCHHGLRQMDQALACIEQALDIDPAFEAARAMRLQLQAAGRYRGP